MAGNPLQSNGALQSMMKELDSISDEEQFLNWRSSFLEELESYLGDPASIEKARAADAAVLAKMPKVEQAIAKIEACLDTETGKLNEGVKTQMALRMLSEACQDLEKKLAQLVPSNSADIQKCGYSKWNLAAVLIKTGFAIYADMMYHEKVLPVLVVVLEATHVDRLIIDSVQYYCKRIRISITVLEDLGLMKLMNITRQFLPDTKERPPSKLAEMEEKIVASQPAGERSQSAPKKEDASLAAAQARRDTAPAKMLNKQEKEAIINITTSRDLDAANKSKKLRSTIGRSKSFDPRRDPPKTEKPKGKMKLPGSISRPTKGRGVGQVLSKEEAKEKRMPDPNAHQNKKHAPRRSRTMPSLRKKETPPLGKGKDEEEPPQSSDDAKKDEAAKPTPPVKKQAAKSKSPVRPKPANNGSNGNQAPPAIKGSAQQDRTKTTTTTPAANKENAPAPPKQTAPATENKVPIAILFKERRAKLMMDLSKDTIRGIKLRMEKLTKLPIDEQKLTDKATGTKYNDNAQTLASCGIQEGAEIVLEPLEFEIEVKIMPQGGKLIHLDVGPRTTLKEIKEEIKKQTGLEVEKQELYFKKEELIERAKTVQEMGIKEGSKLVVDVELVVPITVRTMDGKTISLTVNLSNDVLEDVKKGVQKQTGEHASNQKLFMPEDTELVEKKGKTFLRDYGIEEDSELYMEPKIIRITVELPDGKTSGLKVAPTSDMSIIIEAFVRTSTAAKKAKLKFEGKEFPKGVTVKGMGLLEGSVVKLEVEGEEKTVMPEE